MTVNCAGCKWWTEFGQGLGTCELTRTRAGTAMHPESKFLAYVRAADDRISDKADAIMFTDGRGCCNQFSGK